jgi:NADH-quinone oxidoreductase subunit L
MILASALGYGATHKEHILLFILPAVTAGMTAYYMFRLWLLAFTGTPRDQHVHDHAHESPWVMTLPLIFLAVCSIGVAWGWPLWEVDKSYLAHLLEEAEPGAARFPHFVPEHHAAHEQHEMAGIIALALAAIGAAIAVVYFYRRQPTSELLFAPVTGVVKFFRNKWYFDEAYDAAVVRPAVELAFATAAADKQPTDAPPPPGQAELPPKRFDLFTLDGWLNALGQVTGAAGLALRGLQTGRLRGYIVALALTVAALLGILTVLNAG